MKMKIISLAIASALATSTVWAAEQTARISVLPDGSEPLYPGKFNGYSAKPSISKDGNLVVFVSNSGDLVPGDTNGTQDVFVKNRSTKAVTRVSVATGGAQADGRSGGGSGYYYSGYSGDAQISNDGKFVVFSSEAANLVAGDTNNKDVFVHELATGATTLVSVGIDGKPATRKQQVFTGGGTTKDEPIPATSIALAISGDGRYVVFQSNADDLVEPPTDDTLGFADIYVRDRVNSTTTRVGFMDADGNPTSPNDIGEVAVSEDGKFLAFSSRASNLVKDDENENRDVFLYEIATHKVTLVSVAKDGKSAYSDNFREIIDPATDAVLDSYTEGAFSRNPALSADGSKVAFVSNAANLVDQDGNHADDVFVRDMVENTMILASAPSGGGDALITACSFQDSFRAQPANGGKINIVHRHSFSTTFRNGNYYSYGQTCQGSDQPALSSDGKFVAFVSPAHNLIPNDINGADDVFVNELASKQTVLVSASTGGVQADGQSGAPAISGDGRFVAFDSTAANLVQNDNNESRDVFVRDFKAPEPCALPGSGVTVESGATIQTFQSGTSGNCASIAEFRSCDNGVLSGSFVFPSCTNTPDLVSALTVQNNPLKRGRKTTLAVEIKNSGMADATGVTAKVYVPNALSSNSITRCVKTDSDLPGSKLYVCDLGSIPAGQSVTFGGAVRGKKKGQFTVAAQVAGSGQEANAADNNGQLPVTVR
jgi:Tol biopolymer transport system component